MTNDQAITYWRKGAEIIEACLAKATKADPLDAPIPLVGAEARIYHAAQVDAYRHALEMMGPPSDWSPVPPAPPAPMVSGVDVCARGVHCVCDDPSPRRCNAFRDATKLPPPRPWLGMMIEQ